ncbi:MAG: RNA methyltransferase [Bacteroidaceae bacterium]|nr:RNA methyltransferase [Bacteroidaceae bacterium]MBR1492136.1 RNA methyltransferase [Bacteroidaceae bacterium]
MRKLKITEMGRMNAEEFKASEKMPLIVVLDDVRSMYNVGSVFRTADAFRVEAIYLCGITAQPPHPEIHKTALGAEDTVAWQYFPTALDAVHALKQQGYTVYSIEQCEGSTLLNELGTFSSTESIRNEELGVRSDSELGMNNNSQPSTVNCQLSTVNSKYALILGNEVKGVHQEVVDASDGCIEIPQYGTKHSLNVSTTAGIVIWEFAKRLLM